MTLFFVKIVGELCVLVVITTIITIIIKSKYMYL